MVCGEDKGNLLPRFSRPLKDHFILKLWKSWSCKKPPVILASACLESTQQGRPRTSLELPPHCDLLYWNVLIYLPGRRHIRLWLSPSTNFDPPGANIRPGLIAPRLPSFTMETIGFIVFPFGFDPNASPYYCGPLSLCRVLIASRFRYLIFTGVGYWPQAQPPSDPNGPPFVF